MGKDILGGVEILVTLEGGGGDSHLDGWRHLWRVCIYFLFLLFSATVKANLRIKTPASRTLSNNDTPVIASCDVVEHLETQPEEPPDADPTDVTTEEVNGSVHKGEGQVTPPMSAPPTCTTTEAPVNITAIVTEALTPAKVRVHHLKPKIPYLI